MAATVCPAILAENTDEYRKQIERSAHFAVRLHLDLSDGDFAPSKTVAIDEIWWPGGVRADLHVMYRKPFEHMQLMLDLRPQLIIVHAEAEGDFEKYAQTIRSHGVEMGVALLPETPPELIQPALQYIDHVLIFSGDLGHFGGTTDLKLLEKVAKLKAMKPQLEIGWDGGVSVDNARTLIDGGVDVLNAGGFIQRSVDPQMAYQQLAHIAQA